MKSSKIWYHSSEAIKISSFWPLTHFGSLESALTRAAIRYFSNDMSTPGILITTNLDRCSIYPIGQDWYSPKPIALALHLSKHGPASLRPIFHQVWEKMHNNPSKDESPYLADRKLIADILTDNGIDGVSYRNEVEGKSKSISVCITNSNRIEIIQSKLTLTEADLAWAVDPETTIFFNRNSSCPKEKIKKIRQNNPNPREIS